jgi:hypothetical protein
MRHSTPILLLVALFALAAQCLAQQAPSMSPATPSHAAPAVDRTAGPPAADFLASLSLGGSGAVPLSGCTSNSQCPPKQLCCLACGFPDCTAHACFVPMNGHCPLIP